MTVRTAAAIFASGLLALGTAFAADQTDTPAGYVRSGETEHCLQTRRIDSLRILNKTQILVEMNNGERYLQQPRSCSPLRKQYVFAYEVFGGQLCDTTQVTLHDAGLDFGVTGICIFDKFEKLEKQSAAAN